MDLGSGGRDTALSLGKWMVRWVVVTTDEFETAIRPEEWWVRASEVCGEAVTTGFASNNEPVDSHHHSPPPDR